VTVPEERRTLPVPWTPAQAADSKVLAAADLAIGFGVGAIGFARSLARRGRPYLQPVVEPVAGIVRSVVPPAEQARLRAQVREVAERGRQERVALVSAATRGVLRLVPEVTAAVLDQIDVTSLVTDRVDLDTVAAGLDVERVVDRVDLDSVAARIDVNALLDRLDLAGIARYVIEEVDLPEIIRSSTGSIMTDSVRGMRMQSIVADERLGKVVDRALLRRRPRLTDTPLEAGPDDGRREPRA
jgi:hypothetical protein